MKIDDKEYLFKLMGLITHTAAEICTFTECKDCPCSPERGKCLICDALYTENYLSLKKEIDEYEKTDK